MKQQMTPEEKAANEARVLAMIARRQADIKRDIIWWKQQEQFRIEGFDIMQTDPMYVKLNEHHRTRKLEELL